MSHVSHGSFGPTEKETVEIEPGEENSKGENSKVTKSREAFLRLHLA